MSKILDVFADDATKVVDITDGAVVDLTTLNEVDAGSLVTVTSTLATIEGNGSPNVNGIWQTLDLSATGAFIEWEFKVTKVSGANANFMGITQQTPLFSGGAGSVQNVGTNLGSLQCKNGVSDYEPNTITVAIDTWYRVRQFWAVNGGFTTIKNGIYTSETDVGVASSSTFTGLESAQWFQFQQLESGETLSIRNLRVASTVDVTDP